MALECAEVRGIISVQKVATGIHYIPIGGCPIVSGIGGIVASSSVEVGKAEHMAEFMDECAYALLIVGVVNFVDIAVAVDFQSLV